MYFCDFILGYYCDNIKVRSWRGIEFLSKECDPIGMYDIALEVVLLYGWRGLSLCFDEYVVLVRQRGGDGRELYEEW